MVSRTRLCSPNVDSKHNDFNSFVLSQGMEGSFACSQSVLSKRAWSSLSSVEPKTMMQRDSDSSSVSGSNGSVMVLKLSMNSALHCTLWENKPTSDSVHIVGECSSVVPEQNSVQDT